MILAIEAFMMNKQTSAVDQTKMGGSKFTCKFACLAWAFEFGAFFSLSLHHAFTLFLAEQIVWCVHVDNSCIESSLESFCIVCMFGPY